MKKLLSLLCALFAAIGLPGCDYLNVRELKPGVSTAAEVRERFGPPQMEWLNTDGSVTWEYSRQPEGAECYMITVGPDNILRQVDQVLNETQFARVQTGMSGDEVRRLLGRPAARQFFQLKRETVWEWLIERGSTIVDPTYFTVSFDEQGRVSGTGRYNKPKP
ncbi:outer membrane protein assembly factor BamE domain-containing protein [Pseudothauera rhizosphaerae]|uniref:Outer membrane protein assembly factor BamE n=1 Tax=Pseudothauera rhizosphaerae TaxID=2565932 RepID=A0A4S4AQF2_9RHOO|nr:outer membrane protein assembly factor BamE [Pseudothauera rhizosphaerae]THF61979.1 outer membrane protein assembly factor BamE [Pseudothauera rhizosphaerae]